MNNNTKNMNPHQVLVVDDSSASLKLLTDILTNQGYKVRPASDGRLALRSVAVELPDIILLDVKMPEMDGYEVCRLLKSDEKSRGIPVIFISALEETTAKVKGFEAGGVDYITKPFEAAEVLARVETHLNLRRLQENMEELVRQRTAELSEANVKLKAEIVQRRRAEEELRKVNRTLKMLSDCNQTVVRAKSEKALLHDICRIIAEIGSYEMVWIGFAEQDEEKTVRHVAHAGSEGGYLKAVKVTWGEDEQDSGPTGMAISTGVPVVCRDLSKEQTPGSWRVEAIARRYQSAIAIPLTMDGHVLGALSIFSNIAGEFDSDEVNLLTELAGDVAYGITALRTQNERDKAQEALQESEEKYRELVNNANSIILRMDKYGNVTFFNEFAQRFFEYSESEIVGKNVVGTIVPKVESTGRNLELMIEDIGLNPDRYANNINENMRSNGERVWIAWTNKPVRDENGQVIDILCVGNDITERKMFEDALSKSEEKYRLTFSSVSDVIYTIDSDLRITSISPNVEKILGYKPEELVNRPFSELNVLAPEYLKTGVANAMRVFAGEQVPSSVYEFIAKDGTRRFGEISASPLIQESRIVGITSVARDITERKRMEQELRDSEIRYRTIFENTGTAMVIVEKDLTISLLNAEVEKLTGYNKNEIEGKKKWSDFVTHEHLEEMKEYHLLRRTNPSEVPKSYVFQMIDREGKIADIFVTVAMIPGTTKSVASMIDMTERKKLEAQIRQAQKMEAIGTLAGGIAHDFNNILGAIMGYTDMALRGSIVDRNLRRYLEHVYQAGERARDLVKQILTFSRQTEQERKPVQLSVIMKEVLKLLRSSLPTTIEIHQDITTPLHKDFVLADPTQIHQILMNLCTNAAHSMRAKGGHLGVSMSEIEVDAAHILQYPGLEPGTYVKLTVSDTGHGMDAAVLERIFDPYFTTKAPGEGTGLGLAVVQGIIKSHGGAIAVFSEPGKGSIFHVFLPRYVADLPSEVEEAQRPPTGDERILLIDDEEVLGELGREMLESLGYRVTAIASSPEALEKFRNKPDAFDLIFTDMTMPKMTGIELANECMNIRPDIPIILGTGFSEMIDDKKAKELGIRAFVLKPYVMKEIAKTIRKVLDEHYSL